MGQDEEPEVPPADYEDPQSSSNDESQSKPSDVESKEKHLKIEDHSLGVEKLSDDLGHLLDSQIDTDVTIKAGGLTFPAHHLILKFRCPELLRTARAVPPLAATPASVSTSSSCCSRKPKRQPEELQEGTGQERKLMSYVIELESPPFSEQLITGLLRYIYTARIEVLGGIVEELLDVAGQNQLFELKDRLERHLSDSVNAENCVKLLRFADRDRGHSWNCRILKRKALKFINDQIPVIIEQEEFKSLKRERPELLEEVLRAAVFGDGWIEHAA